MRLPGLSSDAKLVADALRRCAYNGATTCSPKNKTLMDLTGLPAHVVRFALNELIAYGLIYRQVGRDAEVEARLEAIGISPPDMLTSGGRYFAVLWRAPQTSAPCAEVPPERPRRHAPKSPRKDLGAMRRTDLGAMAPNRPRRMAPRSNLRGSEEVLKVVSSRPAQPDARTASEPVEPADQDETRRDDLPPSRGEGQGQIREPNPALLPEAGKLRSRLRDDHGIALELNADRTGFTQVPTALRPWKPDPGPEDLASLERLRAELLAILQGGDDVARGSKPPPAARDPAFSIEVAEGLARDRDGAGLLMHLFCGRWRDTANATTSEVIEDALAILGPERTIGLIHRADAQSEPAKWFTTTVAAKLPEARKRARAGEKGTGRRVSVERHPGGRFPERLSAY